MATPPAAATFHDCAPSPRIFAADRRRRFAVAVEAMDSEAKPLWCAVSAVVSRSVLAADRIYTNLLDGSSACCESLPVVVRGASRDTSAAIVASSALTTAHPFFLHGVRVAVCGRWLWARQSAVAMAEGGPSSLCQLRSARLVERYGVERVLGTGGFGVVSRARSLATRQAVAVKSISASKVRSDMPEVVILPGLKHPNIVSFIEAFSDGQYLHIVMELLSGESLRQKVGRYWASEDAALDAALSLAGLDGRERRGKGLPSALTWRYLRDLLSAVVYLHGAGYIHRDIKADNAMLLHPRDSSLLKLVDFGACCAAPPATEPPLTDRVGTPGYLAPEVLAGAYREKCDVWSCGVVAFLMCVGYTPFESKTTGETLELVRVGRPKFKRSEWRPLSTALLRMVGDMLTRDASIRPTAAELLERADAEARRCWPALSAGCITT